MDQPKSIRRRTKNEIENLTKENQNGHGMEIDSIEDPLIEFVIHVIEQKFYQSSRLNNMPCIVVDLGYKII